MCAQVLEGDALQKPVERVAKVAPPRILHYSALFRSCFGWQERRLKKAPSNWKHACLGELWDFLQQEIEAGRYEPKFVFDRHYDGN